MKLSKLISDGTARGIAVGIVHIILILLAYSSPFWVDWKIILAVVLVLYLQYAVLKGCILAKPQYGNTSDGLYENILTSLGITFDRTRLKFVVEWVLPAIVLLISLVWQLLFGFQVILKV